MLKNPHLRRPSTSLRMVSLSNHCSRAPLCDDLPVRLERSLGRVLHLRVFQHTALNLIWFILLVLALLSAVSCARKVREAPLNEQPMYGGLVVPPEDLAADSKSNQASIRETGSKEAAVKKAIQEGWASFQRGYFELAMHRFNQAWLLDPKNPEVFNGFALVLAAQKKIDDAIGIYQKYLEINPDHGLTLCRVARQYQNKAVAKLTETFQNDEKENEAKEYFEKAFLLYEKAVGKATLDEDLSFIYYQWAIALAINKDFKAAWEKVHLSKKHGGGFIEKEFIQALSKDMPDPGESKE